MNFRISIVTALMAVSGSAFAAEAIQTPAATEAQATSAPTEQAIQGTVARASIASDIQGREPTDSLKQLENTNDKVFYFTELRDLAGQTITHRWEHDGKVMAEVPFEIGGPRWRIFSSKNLDPSWTGEWKVSVVTASGDTLSVNTFNYTAAATDAGNANQTAPAEGTATQ
jgi:Protein of unknown function (DUF2914)